MFRPRSILSMTLFAFALLVPAFAVPLLNSSSGSYELVDSFHGENFFDNFDFFTGEDPTHGFVTYVDRNTAETSGFINVSPSGSVHIGVDSTTTLDPSGPGRGSVRIRSKTAYDNGLFVADLKHIPGNACGIWPAFWTLGPDWPTHGEVDIVEGVNLMTSNQVTLHGSDTCSITATDAAGTVTTNACAGQGLHNIGCVPLSSGTFGTSFNNAGGGVYAMELVDSHIAVWFFPRDSIPTSITDSRLDVSTFGTPAALFQGPCDLTEHFNRQRLVFDVTFCGDLAGSLFAVSGCLMNNLEDPMQSCVDYVAANPSDYEQSYWEISSLNIYRSTGNISASPSAFTPNSLVPHGSSVPHASSTRPILTPTSSARARRHRRTSVAGPTDAADIHNGISLAMSARPAELMAPSAPATQTKHPSFSGFTSSLLSPAEPPLHAEPAAPSGYAAHVGRHSLSRLFSSLLSPTEPAVQPEPSTQVEHHSFSGLLSSLLSPTESVAPPEPTAQGGHRSLSKFLSSLLSPVGPVTPAEPLLPVKPAVSSGAAISAEPAACVEPVTCGEPAVPAKPVISTDPITPSKPVISADPVMPVEPAESGTCIKQAMSAGLVASAGGPCLPQTAGITTPSAHWSASPSQNSKTDLVESASHSDQPYDTAFQSLPAVPLQTSESPHSAVQHCARDAGPLTGHCTLLSLSAATSAGRETIIISQPGLTMPSILARPLFKAPADPLPGPTVLEPAGTQADSPADTPTSSTPASQAEDSESNQPSGHPADAPANYSPSHTANLPLPSSPSHTSGLPGGSVSSAPSNTSSSALSAKTSTAVANSTGPNMRGPLASSFSMANRSTSVLIRPTSTLTVFGGAPSASQTPHPSLPVFRGAGSKLSSVPSALFAAVVVILI